MNKEEIQNIIDNLANSIFNTDWTKLLDYIKDLQKKAELGEHYKHLYSEVKKQKDDVVEYIKKHIQEYDVDGSPTNLDEFDFLASPKILLRMLGEIDE